MIDNTVLQTLFWKKFFNSLNQENHHFKLNTKIKSFEKFHEVYILFNL